jgi:hypothetical protein
MVWIECEKSNSITVFNTSVSSCESELRVTFPWTRKIPVLLTGHNSCLLSSYVFTSWDLTMHTLGATCSETSSVKFRSKGEGIYAPCIVHIATRRMGTSTCGQGNSPQAIKTLLTGLWSKPSTLLINRPWLFHLSSACQKVLLVKTLSVQHDLLEKDTM